MFQLCHPGPTGRGGRRLFPLGTGMPQDVTDENFVMCGQCGFMVDLSKVVHGDSEDSPGLDYVQTTVNIPGGTKTVWEAKVVGGCPMCGSLNPTLNNKMLPYIPRNPNTLRMR